MFQYLPAMERVAFQPHSTLAGKTVALCAEFLDWVEATRQSRLVDGKLPPATAGRINEAMKQAKAVFAPQLMKILADELHLNVQVICCEDRMINCAMLPMFREADWMQVDVGKDFYSGTLPYTAQEFNPALFESLDTSVNLKTSTFKAVPKNFLMGLFIFIPVYLGTEVFGNVDSWTAEEHAAVLLHECGHALATFEHMLDFYHKADMAGNSVRYLSQTNNNAAALATVTTLETAVSQSRNTEWSQAFDTAIIDIKKDRDKVNRFSPEIASLVLLYFIMVISTIFGRLITAGSFGAINESRHKSSDTVVTESNPGYNERIADEFVSRHGLGAALASGLVKMEKNGYVRSGLADALHNTAVVKSIIGTFKYILFAVFGMLLYVEDDTYDPLWLRIEHILRNNMVIFKDESLSDELRTHFLKETADLLQTVAELKSNKGYKISQLFWGTIMRILSRGSILDGLRTAGLSADYDILQRLTGGLVKNSLYYHAARLKSL